MDIKLVLATSMLCQFAAAVVAVALIRVTHRWLGWALIAAAMLLQCARRGIVLFEILHGGTVAPHDVVSEWTGLFISIFMLVGVCLVVPLFRSLRRTKNLLRQHNRDLLEAREAERRVLAGELHDSLGHRLFAMQLSLERSAAQPPVADAPTARMMADQCGEVIAEVRQICHGLYPPTLESLGLCESLQQLAVDFKGAAVIEVTCGGIPTGQKLPGAVEIACFRIAQESISNALRHGGATRVRVNLRLVSGQLQLSVEDDGRGFEPGCDATGGLGLATMRHRAGALGGSMEVHSQPGQTVVTATIPISGKPRPDADDQSE